MIEFRDLKQQYEFCKIDIDDSIIKTIEQGTFIGGDSVKAIEKELKEYVGVKNCISCANGTDALSLALMAWNIGSGDAVFLPDFTFFATAEAVVLCGAKPIFIDVLEDTYNMNPEALETEIRKVIEESTVTPRVIISVDLFGLPADYNAICEIAQKYGLLLLEDGAQGFGGNINKKKACSFGDISTTSFFPAKPLGCYGDGGAIFTDNDKMAEILSSLKVHGKGTDKYDNIRIGLNSRLDTIQASILLVKLRIFREYELEKVNQVADWYFEYLSDLSKWIQLPKVSPSFYSSWAQFTILLEDNQMRNAVQNHLANMQIPSMVYYAKPLHKQIVFENMKIKANCPISSNICKRVLSLPMHPYLNEESVKRIAFSINDVIKSK